MATDRLNTPGRRTRWLPRLHLPDDAFGSFAETFARYMGTASFILPATALMAPMPWPAPQIELHALGFDAP